jgi:hypothetical protein
MTARTAGDFVCYLHQQLYETDTLKSHMTVCLYNFSQCPQEKLLLQMTCTDYLKTILQLSVVAAKPSVTV